MELTFNKNSWHHKFYGRAYPDRENQIDNFCPYARAIIWALICLPFTWWTYLGKDFKFEPHGERLYLGFFSFLCFCVFEILGLVILSGAKVESAAGWMYFAAIPLVIAVFFFFIYFIHFVCYLIGKTLDIISNLTTDKPKKEVDNLLFSYIKAKKNKICPKINWK